jgi:hypothetical protein
MEPVAIHCPNCGADLGPLEDGQYHCSYCGHRSGPPQVALDQARQDELVARAIAKQDAARFARERAAAEELAERGRAAGASGMRAGAGAIKSVVVMMVVFAVMCFGVAIYVAINGITPFFIRHVGGLDSHSAPLVVLFFFAMGALMLGVAAKMFFDGRRTFGARLIGTRGDRRLIDEGLQGRAVVTSYRQQDLLADVAKFDLVLRVELVGRLPYVVKRTERVPCPRVITTGAELPVFVDPEKTDRMMIDWDTAERM